MYLSAERLAVANQAVQQTFEQSSVAWQAIPHWDTRDPAQTRVRSDNASARPIKMGPLGGNPLKIRSVTRPFYVTLAQATAQTPDALLAAVIARTVNLAAEVDRKVITKLFKNAVPAPKSIPAGKQLQDILNALIDARVHVEDAGYRAPSCLLVDTNGLKMLSKLTTKAVVAVGPLLDGASIDSWYRVDKLDKTTIAAEDGKGGPPAVGGEGTGRETPERPAGTGAGSEPDDTDQGGDSIDPSGPRTTQPDDGSGRMLLLGRRQRIAQGGAAAVTSGEEPVDLAVSVPPSLEVVGETRQGYIELAIRIRFATRITDKSGVVGVVP